MKKILIVAAAAGLMTLAACQPTATNTTTTDNMATEANASDYNAVATTGVDNVTANATDMGNMTDTNMSGNAM